MSRKTDQDRLAELCNKTHKDQAIWFLNGYWTTLGEANAEQIWDYVHKFVELDDQHRQEGTALDEFKAHRFLEIVKETLTVHAMRDRLRATGAIGQSDRPKQVPLTHFLLWKFGVDWKELANAPQGSAEELEKAKRLLEAVQSAFAEAERRDSEAAAALREAHSRESEAKQRESEAVQREDELRAAKAELEAALGEVKAQEDAYNSRTAQLKRASEEGGLVSRNKAKNELAQHLGEDPLPLRKAKITAEAAVKKAEKATQVAEAATTQASHARGEAEQARHRSEEAKQAAEAALDDASRKVEEAEAYLEEAKNRGSPRGQIWWLERELHEAKAYLPASRGGYRKERK
eukprot:TRINITY_DN76_c0_g1_i2.p1 TRINITY_DN76_c0_g1~~TRINITY_DN76_c0_g1_i2.p1  ORF type:complete len:347 (-),score=99.49 TRINITY_DN76_c0_g1_i2:103-1143(-)